MKNIAHPNIIRYFDLCGAMESPHQVLIMEAAHINLFKLMFTRLGPMNTSLIERRLVREILRRILQGLLAATIPNSTAPVASLPTPAVATASSTSSSSNPPLSPPPASAPTEVRCLKTCGCMRSTLLRTRRIASIHQWACRRSTIRRGGVVRCPNTQGRYFVWGGGRGVRWGAGEEARGWIGRSNERTGATHAGCVQPGPGGGRPSSDGQWGHLHAHQGRRWELDQCASRATQRGRRGRVHRQVAVRPDREGQ